MAARRRFVTLDVFTDRALTGNPLAVVLDAQGLDDAAMQAIAAEFNLSETVFVLPPDVPRHRAKLRIFTPKSELPFAGHPTVGTAALLALQDRDGHRGEAHADAVAFGLEEAIGIVPCVVTIEKRLAYARFKIPRLPAFIGPGLDRAALAAMLGLAPADLGLRRHQPSRHQAGPAFTFVPIASREKLDAARLDTGAFHQALERKAVDALYLYASEPGGHYQARMFAPQLGVSEDPATGSAAAAFAGVLMQHEPLGDGTHDVTIRQGVAMGRPSEIALQLAIEGGQLRSVEIGGAAVVITEGVLLV